MAFYITEKCVGCTVCASLCPVYAISGEKGARHEINAARCVECGVCGKACPKGAVNDASGKEAVSVPRSAWKKPVFDTELCSACSLCVNICRAGALKVSVPEFQGDISAHAYLENPKKCVGCGLCEKVCPLGVITCKEV